LKSVLNENWYYTWPIICRKRYHPDTFRKSNKSCLTKTCDLSSNIHAVAIA